MLVIEDPGERGVGIDLLDIVLGQGHRRRLDDLGREHRLERLRHGQRDEAGPGAPGGAGDEQGGARVIERARDDQQLAERALVPACRPFRQEAGRDRVVKLRRTVRERHVGLGSIRDGDLTPAEADGCLAGHQVSVASRVACAAACKRSSRARIRRSRSSMRSSMSRGKTYLPPVVRTPKAIATA